DPTAALRCTFHPLTLAGIAVAAAFLGWLERRLDQAPEFSLGLLLGSVTVLTTTLLNAITLRFGGAEPWGSLILLVFVAHLPVAALEGVILGFILSFLARVKPEMLRPRVA